MLPVGERVISQSFDNMEYTIARNYNKRIILDEAHGTKQRSCIFVSRVYACEATLSGVGLQNARSCFHRSRFIARHGTAQYQENSIFVRERSRGVLRVG